MSERRSPAVQFLARAARGGVKSARGAAGIWFDSPVHASASDDEDRELARLIEEVREARERLTRLITTIKSERAGWEEREKRWERWRSSLPTPPRKPPISDVH